MTNSKLSDKRNIEIIPKEENLPTVVFNKVVEKKDSFSEIANFDFNYKLKKLKMLIDNLIPEDFGERLKNSLTNYKLRNCLTRDVAVALSAIAESNRMQGHYSAEKILSANVNMDLDIEHAKQVMRDLIAENKKEF